MERLKNVDFYVDGQDLKGQPHFDLVIKGKVEQAHVKVTCSGLKAQSGYDKFQLRVYEVILALDDNLDTFMPTILYRCLEIYNLISEIKVEQGNYLSGKDSSYISSRLAELFDMKIMKKSPQSLDGRSMQMTFTIQGKQVEIVNSHFTYWVLDLIKQKIKDDDFPYSFGLDMLNLQESLMNDSVDQLSHLYKFSKPPKYMEGRQLIASFCIQLHQAICTIQGKNSKVFDSKQLKFYASLISIFDLPHAHEYSLVNPNQRLVLDRLRKLLKRNSDI